MSILDIIVADKSRYINKVKDNMELIEGLQGYRLASVLDKLAYELYINKSSEAKCEHSKREVANTYDLNDYQDFSFSKVLEESDFTIIGEIKRGSPSKGLFAPDLSVRDKVNEYRRAGIRCISVLTDHNYFYGSYSDLTQVRSMYDGEILNKDFIIDEIQIDIARNLGATVVLLIVAALEDSRLNELYKYTKALGISVIVEVHNEVELLRALQLKPRIIGINNRNLKTFHTDIDVSLELMDKLRDEKDLPLLISESGIHSSKELKILKSVGYNGALIGESLIRGTQDGVI